jgi:hypothetical protein
MDLSRTLGGRLAILGGVLAVIGNLLHPRFDGDSVDIYRDVADSDVLVPANLLIIAALLLTTVGVMAVAWTLLAGPGRDLARAGSVAVLAGGILGVLQFGVENFAYRQLARLFVSADDNNRQGAFWATSAVDHVNSAMFATWSLLFLGLGPLLIGAAMLVSRQYPSWLSAAGMVGGLICFVVGVVNLVREDQSTLDIPFLIGSLLATAWIIASGVLLVRDEAASRTAPAL